MAQFKYYNSNDSGSPVLNGLSGSLINVLDSCLVYGYVNHPPVGWTKPIANIATPHCGCWKQPSGSQFVVYVNDAGPGVAGVKEARACGWESLTTMSVPIGTGSGQFPTPAQQLTLGYCVVRKSNNINDSSSRAWQMFADDRTFYLFTLPDQVVLWTGLWFGDIYSYSSTDRWKCQIQGKYVENSAGGGTQIDDLDRSYPVNNTTTCGKFMARTYSGGGASINVHTVTNLHGVAANAVMLGGIQAPNSINNSMYLMPLYVAESVTPGIIRGKHRGLCSPCHVAATWTDGQIIQGANEFSGRTYRIVKGGNLLGIWAVEISDTLDTN